jgi:predicted metal-dependent phosphoesterase TrpH
MKVDLHIHSHCSDGKYSPARIVEYAVKNGLGMISLTDHDTIAGLSEARKAVERFGGVKFIPGVELSTSLNGEELHILGYGIDETHSGLLNYMETTQANRQKRICRILHQLEEVGIHITINEVRNGLNTSSLGRMHIAHALIKHEYVQTIRDAFDQYLGYDARVIKLFPSDFFLSPFHAVKVILDAGGIAVLAHPTIDIFDRYIDMLREYGLGGVEVFKGTRSSIEEFYFETVGKDKGLLLTGGSDWHGHHTTRNLGSFYVDSERIKPFLEAIHLS